MIDQTQASSTAKRRIFHSKVDSIRPTYGFEDVSLAPGTSTIEPADVELGVELCGIPLAIPILAAAMDAVVDARFAGELARLGGLAVLNLEGVQTRYDEPGRGPRPDRRGTRRRGPGPPRRGLRRADPRRARRPPNRRDPGGRVACGRRVDPGVGASVRAVLRRARRGPVPRPVAGQQRPPPRDRLRPALARGVHPVHADPGRGRQHDERRGRVRPDGAGRRGGLRRRRARAPPARRARSSGSASRRSPRSATSPRPATPISPRPAATSRSSPTAACAAAASWPRRSPPAPTP